MITRGRRNRWCIAALAGLLPIQLLALTTADDTPGDAAGTSLALGVPEPAPLLADAPLAATPPSPAERAPTDVTPVEVELPSEPVEAAPVPGPSSLVTESDVVIPVAQARTVAATASSPDAFVQRFPAQAAARQDARPASTRWALLIGINEHLGRVSDNFGSRQDAEALRAHLLANGWLDDHILLITDRDATRAMMLRGMTWLGEKTDSSSLAVFHYSGHSKKWYGQDHDGDGEITDEGLWPTDDGFIPDSEFARALDGVNPFALWINLSTCNAAGLVDPGLVKPGRLITASSQENQKSYENPAWSNSVWGYHLIDKGMLERRGDLNRDGRVTVEEAYTWARPRAHQTTVGQSHGTQDAVIVDNVPGDFDFVIPRPPPPPTTTTTAPPPPPPPERQGLCLFCGR